VNASKTQEQKNGKRWRTDESCREQPDLVEEASLSSHLYLGTASMVVEVLSKVVEVLSKVVEVLSKVIEVLKVLVSVCDVCRE
jgi:hypothetical protein